MTRGRIIGVLILALATSDRATAEMCLLGAEDFRLSTILDVAT